MRSKRDTLPKVSCVVSPVWIIDPLEILIKAMDFLPRNVLIHPKFGISFCGVHSASETQVKNAHTMGRLGD